MKNKIFWTIVVLLGITAVVLIVSRPRDLPAPECFPESVFTTEDMRARVDCHPDEYKIEITRDTVVLFAYPGLIDWVGPIFVIHVPSVSEIVLNTDGSTFFEGYKSPEGQKAVKEVLNDPDLMDRILKRAKEIEEIGGP